MRYFLSVDGGGSKTNALLFDEDLNILGKGKGTGVNGRFATLPHIHTSIRECLQMCFEGFMGITIERLYMTLIGPKEVFFQELTKVCQCEDVILIPEAQSGLLAGNFILDGISVLAGTGAAARYYKNGKTVSIGGWGGLLGDQGSGFKIGLDGLQAAVKAWMGWGTDTLIIEGLQKLWNIDDLHKLLPIIYKSTSYQQQVAHAARAVGYAAKKGDKVANSIYIQGGTDLFLQTKCLFEKCETKQPILKEHKIIVIWGGTWKGSSIMSKTYIDATSREFPDFIIKKALFESVIAGVIYHCIKENNKIIDEIKKEEIKAKFQEYLIKWE